VIARALIAVVWCLLSGVAPAAAEGLAALLPRELAATVVQQCSRAVPRISGTWQPSESQIRQLEADVRLLEGHKDEACCNPAASLKDPLRYYRQYVGVIRDGRRLIYINAFRDPAPPDWRTAPVVVCDGGDGYWGVLYDPALRTFSQLAFNGIG
jgi:hypothetical protein